MTRERSNASGTVFLTNKAIYRKQNMRVYHNLMWTFGIPDFITSLVGWSVIIDYRLVISLFQQLMVTQLRILEWYPSLTARQTVNVFVPTHIALPSPDNKEKKENHVKAYAPWGALSLDQRDSLTSKLDGYPTGWDSPLSGSKPVHEENCQGIKLRIAHKIKRLNSRLQVKRKSRTRHIVSNSHSGELRHMAQSTDRALLLPRRYHQGFLK